jgi:hypothetical protein
MTVDFEALSRELGALGNNRAGGALRAGCGAAFIRDLGRRYRHAA